MTTEKKLVKDIVKAMTALLTLNECENDLGNVKTLQSAAPLKEPVSDLSDMMVLDEVSNDKDLGTTDNAAVQAIDSMCIVISVG